MGLGFRGLGLRSFGLRDVARFSSVLHEGYTTRWRRKRESQEVTNSDVEPSLRDPRYM